MHYYPFNIGDYRRRSSHLTLLEHGIYRVLIDTYYLEESPLTKNKIKLMRTHNIRTPIEIEAFENVLSDFFIKTKKGYVNKTCDDVISKYQEKSEKARASANIRWNANASKSHSKRNANQEPRTKNQKPVKDNDVASTKFNFKKELLFIGVSKETLEDWLIVRKKKKASNTKTAFNGLINQIKKSGLSPEEAIKIATEKSWSGFNASWLDSNSKSTVGFEKPDGKEYTEWGTR